LYVIFVITLNQMSKSPPFYYSCLDYDKGGIIYYNNKNMITLYEAHNHSNQVANVGRIL